VSLRISKQNSLYLFLDMIQVPRFLSAGLMISSELFFRDWRVERMSLLCLESEDVQAKLLISW
jgi:hypothetical protein